MAPSKTAFVLLRVKTITFDYGESQDNSQRNSQMRGIPRSSLWDQSRLTRRGWHGPPAGRPRSARACAEASHLRSDPQLAAGVLHQKNLLVCIPPVMAEQFHLWHH